MFLHVSPSSPAKTWFFSFITGWSLGFQGLLGRTNWPGRSAGIVPWFLSPIGPIFVWEFQDFEVWEAPVGSTSGDFQNWFSKKKNRTEVVRGRTFCCGICQSVLFSTRFLPRSGGIEPLRIGDLILFSTDRLYGFRGSCYPFRIIHMLTVKQPFFNMLSLSELCVSKNPSSS